MLRPPFRGALGLLLIALCSCAQTQIVQTGFLTDYGELEPTPERTVRFVPDEIHFYEKDGVDWGAYDSVIIEPTAYRPHASAPELDADGQKRVGDYFNRKLRKEFGAHLELVDEPRDDTLRVRVAINEVNRSNVVVNWVAVLLLFPVDMGGISGEMEIQDAESGEVLMAMSACRDGTPFLLIECFNTYGHARHGSKKWAREMRRVVRPDEPEG